MAYLRLEPSTEQQVRGLLGAWESARGLEGCYRMADGTLLARIRLSGLADLEQYVMAARAGGCSVRADVVSATVFERWAVPVESGGGVAGPRISSRGETAG